MTWVELTRSVNRTVTVVIPPAPSTTMDSRDSSGRIPTSSPTHVC